MSPDQASHTHDRHAGFRTHRPKGNLGTCGFVRQLPKIPENIAKGKEIYEGKGNCFICHGKSGKGDGPAGQILNPSPRNFANPKFDKVRTPGEMFWVIGNGSPGTGMVPLSPPQGTQITEDAAWLTILYERSFGEAHHGE